MRFILTADWHIRNTIPRCRLDNDWIDTQRKALNQIVEKAIEKKCYVCVVGDIFHNNTDTTFECIKLVQDVAIALKKHDLKLYMLAGNHDLPYHSTENIKRSAIGLLLDSDNIYQLSELGDTVSAGNFDEETEDKEIIFKHILCFPDLKSLPPNVNAITAKELSEEYNNAKWIFTGDYHHNFVYLGKSTVVNSGCLLRQTSDMKDYQPVIYFIDTNKEIIEEIPIIDNVDLIDDSYILKQEEREQRIENFVDKLKSTESISLDFIENVKNELLRNDIAEELKNKIELLLEV